MGEETETDSTTAGRILRHFTDRILTELGEHKKQFDDFRNKDFADFRVQLAMLALKVDGTASSSRVDALEQKVGAIAARLEEKRSGMKEWVTLLVTILGGGAMLKLLEFMVVLVNRH